MKKKINEEIKETVKEVGQKGQEKTDKEILTELYAMMKTYGINSIGDVEVKISRL